TVPLLEETELAEDGAPHSYGDVEETVSRPVLPERARRPRPGLVGSDVAELNGTALVIARYLQLPVPRGDEFGGGPDDPLQRRIQFEFRGHRQHGVQQLLETVTHPGALVDTFPHLVPRPVETQAGEGGVGLESNIVRSPARGPLPCLRVVSDRGCVCDRVPRLRRSQASNEESDRPDTESGRGRSSTPEFRTGRHRAPRAWTTRATASRKAHAHGPTAASGEEPSRRKTLRNAADTPGSEVPVLFRSSPEYQDLRPCTRAESPPTLKACPVMPKPAEPSWSASTAPPRPAKHCGGPAGRPNSRAAECWRCRSGRIPTSCPDRNSRCAVAARGATRTRCVPRCVGTSAWSPPPHRSTSWSSPVSPPTNCSPRPTRRISSCWVRRDLGG